MVKKKRKEKKGKKKTVHYCICFFATAVCLSQGKLGYTGESGVLLWPLRQVTQEVAVRWEVKLVVKTDK